MRHVPNFVHASARILVGTSIALSRHNLCFCMYSTFAHCSLELHIPLVQITNRYLPHGIQLLVLSLAFFCSCFPFFRRAQPLLPSRKQGIARLLRAASETSLVLLPLSPARSTCSTLSFLVCLLSERLDTAGTSWQFVRTLPLSAM